MLAAQGAQMGLFSRRQQPQPINSATPPAPPASPAGIDFAAALEIFAVKAVEKQTEFAAMQHQQTLELVNLNAEIARNMVRTGGKRLGGKVRAKTAKRDSRGRMRPDCRLCENAAITDPTADEIRRHMTHDGRPRIEAPRETASANLNGFQPVPVEIQIDPRTGDEVIECEACGANGQHDHSHHLN
jgi:hypothetical protein